ncbi:MAG TPA: hypothetical protein VGK19_23920 [Capsulimonadaceae bacterium]|jgi:translation initiation factor 2B subunit (eIF-2B alpha/beta/delta family)
MDTALICLVFFGSIGWVIKMLLDYLTRLAEIKSTSQAHTSEEIANQISDIKKQIDELRETSGQYEYSLQQVLDTLSQRVAHLEAHTGAAARRGVVAAEVQQVGTNATEL